MDTVDKQMEQKLTINDNLNDTEFYDAPVASNEDSMSSLDDDDIFGSDSGSEGESMSKSSLRYERRMRQHEFEHLERKMHNAGYREGIETAVDEHRQVGFEQGMMQGMEEGKLFGVIKGYERAMHYLRSFKEDEPQENLSLLNNETSVVMRPEHMKQLQGAVQARKQNQEWSGHVEDAVVKKALQVLDQCSSELIGQL